MFRWIMLPFRVLAFVPALVVAYWVSKPVSAVARWVWTGEEFWK